MVAEMAGQTGEERYLTAAYDLASHLLVRSHGPDDAPVFVDTAEQDAPMSWGMGNAGILAFLRRLHRLEETVS